MNEQTCSRQLIVVADGYTYTATAGFILQGGNTGYIALVIVIFSNFWFYSFVLTLAS